MSTLLDDAFGHHVWATLRLIDTCLDLDPDQLETAVPGTYGSILETLRHTVAADAGYLSAITGGEVGEVEEATMDLAALRAVMEGHASAWADVLARDLDPTAMIARLRDDGSQSLAPLGIRLAQALHHGSDHRSQVSTALTLLGIEPPAIDVWDFAWVDGRLSEVPPPA